jgi:hypothetical protein
VAALYEGQVHPIVKLLKISGVLRAFVAEAPVADEADLLESALLHETPHSFPGRGYGDLDPYPARDGVARLSWQGGREATAHFERHQIMRLGALAQQLPEIPGPHGVVLLLFMSPGQNELGKPPQRFPLPHVKELSCLAGGIRASKAKDTELSSLL